MVVRIKGILYICKESILMLHTVSSAVLSLVLALCMMLLLCAVFLCYACVVGMDLRFCAVLCSLCVSSVVGVAGGCGSSMDLFRSGVMDIQLLEEVGMHLHLTRYMA